MQRQTSMLVCRCISKFTYVDQSPKVMSRDQQSLPKGVWSDSISRVDGWLTRRQ